MKKTLLVLLAMLAMAGMATAQDIYTVGNFTNSFGSKCVALYRNNQKLYEKVPPLGDYDFDAPSLVMNGTDVYWAVNSKYAATNQSNYGDVYKNGTLYLNNPGGYETSVEDLVYADGHLYSVGRKRLSINYYAPVVWKDNDSNPYLVLGDGTHSGGAVAVTYNNGDLYTLAYEGNGEGGIHYFVSKNGTQLYNLYWPGSFTDIAFYDGDVYTVMTSNSAIKVYKNNQRLYTLTDNWNGGIDGMSIAVDAGDVYVSGHTQSNVKVWKNDQVVVNLAGNDDGNSVAVVANHKGIYHAGYVNGTPCVWKNSTVLYQLPQLESINDIYLEVPCENADIRTLPFVDGFENDETDWSCWTVVDSDHNNGDLFSYWMRSSTGPATGNHCVYHRDNSTIQQGWLVTPRLFLQPGRDNTTLTFKTREWGQGYQGVLVSTNSDINNADSYTEEWTQEHGSNSWKTVTINLNAYQGQAVYIAFKLLGDQCKWNIDDVSVTESWTPCGANASVPFIVPFDNGLNSCWYIIDDDHSGNNKCWQYDSSSHCVVHPWGPSGVPQKGLLFTPKIDLPSGHDYVLRFYSKNQSSGANMSNKVYIAVDESGIPDPSHYYTLCWTDQEFPSNWEEVEISLTAYAGHTVSFCFEYEGTYAHKWFVDDVRLEEEIAQYTITANANNNSWGTVTGGGTYNVGASCTLTATPASGYQFQSWKRNGVVMSTNPTYTFTVTESATYTAYFGEIPINYYTITTAVNPEGAGSVTGGGTYQEGSSITLTAISNAGYMFNHWNDGNTSNPRTVTVTQNATYTAYYDLEEYTIQVYASPAEGGAVTGGGNYHYGETATLTATPAYGYEFAGWSDGVNDNPREVTVTCAAYYVAVFSELGTTYYTVTTNVDPEGAGTVTGGGVYPEATVTALAAEANPGYVFDHWSDGVVANPRVITVNDNMSFTAYFNQNTYNVTVNANPANGGSVSGGGTYVYGDVAVLRATPYNGYDFVGWSDGSNENPHYVTVTGNATYTATFSQAGATYYTVSAYVSPTDAGYVTGSGTYPEGASVTLEAMVYPGYSFSQWNDGVTQNPRAVTVNNNMSFTAYFNIEQYNITVNANPAVGGTVTGGGTYAYGETAVLTATPNMDYSFMQWGDGVMDNPRLVTVTGNATYTALFLTVGGEVYTLTVTSSNPFLGSVFGGGVYPAGSAVDISAFPSLQGRFVKWQDGNTENPRTVILNGDMEFTAEFTAKQQYTIVVNSANPTMGEAFGGGTYNEGDEIGLLAVANEGYRFTQWNDGVTEEYRMVTVTGDATYTAYFVANSVVTHTLTLICNTDEGSVSGGGVYVEGSTATVQAFPNEGFEFDFWNDGNRENPRTVTVNDDLVMIAYFKSTSVDESDMAKLSVYPNPAKERIRIEGLENTCEVVIYNSLGEMVKTANVNSENEIGIQDLASGVYVVRCGNRALRFVKM